MKPGRQSGLSRLARYNYLRFIRLRGEPRELALGMALGIFSGMLPTVPFQMAFAIALAFAFKGSKITAALATWISNPLNLYIVYYLDYRIGAFILGLSRHNRGFASLMETVRNGELGMDLLMKVVGASGIIIAAFIIGGLILGVVTAVPSYFISLKVFGFLKKWRQEMRTKRWLKRNQ